MENIDRYISDGDGGSLFNARGGAVETVCIDGSILEALVEAYNGSLQWTQDHPQLEIYVRDGKLYACEEDLPHEPGLEFELTRKIIPTEIKG